MPSFTNSEGKRWLLWACPDFGGGPFVVDRYATEDEAKEAMKERQQREVNSVHRVRHESDGVGRW